MEKILRKIISLTVYAFLMYYTYNLFIPEHGAFKKSEGFLKSQENIVKYETLLKESKDIQDAGFHLPQGLPENKHKPRFACDKCHSDYPHKKDFKARAFYNMHAFRISCLTCHIDNSDLKKVKFGWFDNMGNFKKEGNTNEFLRIAPYVEFESLASIVENKIKDHDALKKTYKIKITKGEGLSCNSCHAKKGKLFLNLSSLGYNNEKIKQLRNLDETTMFKKDESWTYPDFL